MLIFILAFAILYVVFRTRLFAQLEKIRRIKRSEIILAGISFIISFFLIDGLVRLVVPPVYQSSPYGWQVRENVESKTTVEDSPGSFRTITVKYGKNGFKRWGDINTHKKKILIVGDSFTEMSWVSNGEEWYSYLEKEVEGAEWFVFGGGGYGSLQEFMVLDDFLSVIKPDVVLWQFCGNDYSNNLYELDRLMYPYNNHAVRPYLENGKVVYRLPLPLSVLRKYSFSADRILALYDRLRWAEATKNLDAYMKKRNQMEAEASPSERARKTALQQKAFEATQAILRKVRERVGDKPIFMFNACGRLTDQEKLLCDSNAIACIDHVAESVDSKEAEGHDVKIVNNGHWNKLGNEIAGKKLAEFLRGKISDRFSQ